MLPHVGVGGCTPSPRNESADSITMTRAMSSVATTSHGVNAFGRMWRRRIRPSRLPRACAACTNSRSRSERTAPRTTRAYTTQLETPMTTMMTGRLGPRTPITAIASRMNGNASWMSASRMRTSSVRPPASGAPSEERRPLPPRGAALGGDRDRRSGHCNDGRETGALGGWPATRGAPAPVPTPLLIPPEGRETGAIGGWPATRGAPAPGSTPLLTPAAASSQTDPRIEVRVQHVHRQGHEHEGAGEQEYRRLHHGGIAVGERLPRQAPA